MVIFLRRVHRTPHTATQEATYTVTDNFLFLINTLKISSYFSTIRRISVLKQNPN